MTSVSIIRMIVMSCALGVLGACTAKDDLSGNLPVPLGNFLLGHNIVIADKPQKGPLSRPAQRGRMGNRAEIRDRRAFWSV